MMISKPLEVGASKFQTNPVYLILSLSCPFYVVSLEKTSSSYGMDFFALPYLILSLHGFFAIFS